ncbi:MAG: response regulator [Flavobacteriaceae bacterium]|nr:response regulator [Flavobacteriaceae bacterium]
MRLLFGLLFFLFVSLTWGQNETNSIFKIPSEDSTTIYNYKLKVSQLINPKPDSALYYIQQIQSLSYEKDYIVGKAESYYLFASYFRRIQQPDSAITNFNALYQLSNESGYTKGKSLALNGLCRINYLQGNLDVAIKACKDCLLMKDSITEGYYNIVPDTHIALASAYIRKNELQPAISNLLVVDSIHKKQPLRPDIIAAAFQNLGNIYTDLKDYSTAEEYYLKANEEFKKLPESAANFYMQTTNRHLGEVYYHQEKYSEAETLLLSSRDFFGAIKDERTLAEINTYLGLLNRDLGNLDKAERFFQEALDLNKRNIFDYEASQSGIELSKLYLERNNTSNAIETLNEVLDLNKGNKNSAIDLQVLELMSVAYANRNNYSSAYESLQKATQIKDSLNEIQSAERIKEIEGIYQTESRDREIELLTSQNELAEEQKRNQRNLYLGGLLLTTFTGIFFFFQYRNRQKTNRKLKELDTAKSTFFANISHEFRTPLTLIKGPIEDQLASEKLSPSQRKNLRTAKSNTQRLESLVEQLLALSKLESGNLHLSVQPGNLAKFVKAQAMAFGFAMEEKNIEFEISVKETDANHWFDRDALEKILFNLLGNAVKYTPEGGKIELSTVQSNGYYSISVKNSGIYLNPSERDSIFSRFYQTDPQNPGTGIGLALTKELAELHKGTIRVESEEDGPFTQFNLQLPTSRESYKDDEILSEILQTSEEIPVEPTEELVENEALFPNENAPILLVTDDNKEIREYVGSIFDSSFLVQYAEDGQSGFELASKLIPDIIISDVMMPKLDGFQFTSKVKEHELTSHIPVLLLTAKIEDESKLKGLETGADAYVTKPFSTSYLKATVENLLENRRKLQERFTQEVILTPKDIAVSSADELFLERLQKVMDEHITNSQFSAEIFSSEMGVSRMQLHRKLKALTGQSTTEFLRSQRLKLAANLLREGKISVSEVGYTVGFNDPSYFGKCFKKEYGCTPTEFV